MNLNPEEEDCIIQLLWQIDQKCNEFSEGLQRLESKITSTLSITHNERNVRKAQNSANCDGSNLSNTAALAITNNNINPEDFAINDGSDSNINVNPIRSTKLINEYEHFDGKLMLPMYQLITGKNETGKSNRIMWQLRGALDASWIARITLFEIYTVDLDADGYNEMRSKCVFFTQNLRYNQAVKL